MFKLRFHLANGPHKGHWQIKDSANNVTYIDPNFAKLTLTNCKLHNSRKVAEGIHSGKEKTVCSWIECESISIRYEEFYENYQNEISYNPKIKPHWTNKKEENIDNKFFERLITNGRKVYA